MNAKYFVLAFLGAGLVGAGYSAFRSSDGDSGPSSFTGDKQGAPLVAVSVPEISGEAAQGKEVFDNNCASCHGANAAGQDGVAPPLVHKIYEPGHHADISFQLAVKNGVRSHHWRFGNMPRIEDVTEQDVDAIIAYVRALQRENGIF